MTYLVFAAFGTPKEKLLYTKEEKEQWDRTLGNKLGRWFTLTNIFGTLTSLATVYIFFIGSSKLFGFWTFMCSVTIWWGGYVTNYFTKKICEQSSVRDRLESANQTGGVIAALFWGEKPAAKRTATLTKYVSLANILSIIWLDFAIFADISGSLIGHPSLIARTVLLSVSSFAVIYFTLRYGLRGFVFADCFQSPLLLVASLVLLAGVLVLAIRNSVVLDIGNLSAPILPTRDCILFGLQVISLNSLLVLVTEPHWLRVWIFRKKETEMQVRSTGATAALWLALTAIGLFAYELSGHKIGEPAILSLLGDLSKISSSFLVAFWIGGMAALFASADTQIYSALLVNEFDLRTGQVRELKMANMKPFKTSLVATLVFALLYTLVRAYDLPFEKMIFVVLPVCLNLFPAFVLAALRRPPAPMYLWLSLMLYASFSVAGFLQPRDQFSMTLLAPVAPVIVSLVIVIAHVLRSGGHAAKSNQ